MKRIFLLGAMAALSSCLVSAQDTSGFKGFVDIYGGIGVGSGYDYVIEGVSSRSDLRPLVAFGLSLTEGYQIDKRFFVGVGVGPYSIVDHNYDQVEKWSYNEINSIMLPIFVDGRWTLDLERKITPYVDIKVGYQMSVKVSDGRIYGYWTDNYFFRHDSGMYFQPSVGVRFGRSSAFNLGIAYNALIPQKIMFGKNGLDKNLTEVNKSTYGALMLTLGADF